MVKHLKGTTEDVRELVCRIEQLGFEFELRKGHLLVYKHKNGERVSFVAGLRKTNHGYHNALADAKRKAGIERLTLEERHYAAHRQEKKQHKRRIEAWKLLKKYGEGLGLSIPDHAAKSLVRRAESIAEAKRTLRGMARALKALEETEEDRQLLERLNLG